MTQWKNCILQRLAQQKNNNKYQLHGCIIVYIWHLLTNFSCFFSSNQAQQNSRKMIILSSLLSQRYPNQDTKAPVFVGRTGTDFQLVRAGNGFGRNIMIFIVLNNIWVTEIYIHIVCIYETYDNVYRYFIHTHSLCI